MTDEPRAVVKARTWAESIIANTEGAPIARMSLTVDEARSFAAAVLEALAQPKEEERA